MEYTLPIDPLTARMLESMYSPKWWMEYYRNIYMFNLEIMNSIK